MVETVDDLLKKIESIGAELAETIAKLNAEAAKSIFVAVLAANGQRDTLSRRLMQLRLTSAISDFAELNVSSADYRQEGVNASSDKRSARRIVMSLLAAAVSPVAGTELDEAVIAEGWSKAAADKIKTKLKVEKLASSERGRWSITELGRASLGGLDG